MIGGPIGVVVGAVAGSLIGGVAGVGYVFTPFWFLFGSHRAQGISCSLFLGPI